MLTLPTLFFIGYVASWIIALKCAFTPNVRHPVAWRITATLLTVGLSFLAAARFIGSSVDASGFLHEPFYLIGSGCLLSLAGLCATLMLLLLQLFRSILARGK